MVRFAKVCSSKVLISYHNHEKFYGGGVKSIDISDLCECRPCLVTERFRYYRLISGDRRGGRWVSAAVNLVPAKTLAAHVIMHKCIIRDIIEDDLVKIKQAHIHLIMKTMAYQRRCDVNISRTDVDTGVMLFVLHLRKAFLQAFVDTDKHLSCTRKR